MKTLLLCGYRTRPEDALGLERDSEGRTLIDRRIDQLNTIGSPAVCVLSGALADEQLRHSRRIADAEIAYDNLGEHAQLASNVLAGLEVVEGEACFILPVEIPCPSPAEWLALKEQARLDALIGNAHLVQAQTPQGAPWHYGFPLLVTRLGSSEILRLPELKSLLDTRLKYLHIIAS